MDTFNYSFFEDKPENPETSAEDPPVPPAPDAAHMRDEAEKDPFGFDAFDFGGNESSEGTASTGKGPDLDLEPSEQAPKLVRVKVEPDFDLDAADGDGAFPNISFAPAAPSSLEAEGDDALFDDMGFGSEPPASISLDEEATDDALVSDSFVSDAFELPADEMQLEPIVGARSDDAFVDDALVADSFELPEVDSRSEVQPVLELQLPEPQLIAEVENQPFVSHPVVALPIDAGEIRAAVEPAVFISSPATVGQRKNSAKATRFLTADDPYGEVAPPRERLRVAILGASGIGKNHARWFAKHSCDVVSFLGSSNESVALTRSHLEAYMGFSGRGYSDLGRLLSESQPQAVCIASPSALHYAQAMQCLEAGVHVLCEKPLVYAANRSKRENADGARELLKAAAKRNLVLATQLQYGAATPILCRLAGMSPLEVGDFAMEVETTNSKAPRDPKELWIDLAAHPLSVAQFLAGDGAEIVEETMQLFPSRSAYTSEVSARFGVRCEGGRLLMCRAIVRWFDKIVDNREPRRRFSFNGRVVQYSGVKSPDGTYIAQYVAPDGYISHYADPVDYLVGNFVRTCWDEDELLLSAEQGVQNLDWLLATVGKL